MEEDIGIISAPDVLMEEQSGLWGLTQFGIGYFFQLRMYLNAYVCSFMLNV